MDPSIYQTATSRRILKWNESIDLFTTTMEIHLSRMNAKDHIILLEDIIVSHAGGKRIKIRYRLALSNEILHELKKHFNVHPWNIRVKSSGITLANYDVSKDNLDNERNPEKEYHEFSYSLYRFNRDGETQIFFKTNLHNVEEINSLIFFSKQIRISVFDLQVPREQICCNGFRQGSIETPNVSFCLNS